MATRGPRPAGADTRADILASARTEFAAKGYAGASIRGIAREAGVDPALVHHYFSSKSALFLASVTPGDGPLLNPAAMIDQVINGGPREQIGQRWVLGFLGLWDQAGGERFRAVIHGVTSGEDSLAVLRQMVTQEFLAPLVASLDLDRPDLRAQLAGTSVVGLAVGRYVAVLPQIAEATRDELAALCGPTIQRYLFEPLPNELSEG